MRQKNATCYLLRILFTTETKTDYGNLNSAKWRSPLWLSLRMRSPYFWGKKRSEVLGWISRLFFFATFTTTTGSDNFRKPEFFHRQTWVFWARPEFFPLTALIKWARNFRKPEFLVKNATWVSQKTWVILGTWVFKVAKKKAWRRVFLRS